MSALHRKGTHGLIAVVAIVALAGCGGSSSWSSTATSPQATTSATTSTTASATTSTTATTTTSTTATTPAATQAEFVAKLDDICKRGNAAAKPLSAEVTKAADAGEHAKAAAALEQGQRRNASFKAEVAKLTPPASDQAAFARYQAASSRITALTERSITALKARDLAEVRRLGALAQKERDDPPRPRSISAQRIAATELPFPAFELGPALRNICAEVNYPVIVEPGG